MTTQASPDAITQVYGQQRDVTLIPQRTDLSRLHYFDGRFLRAAHLDQEQAYLRSLARLTNQAGGSGVVHGFDLRLLPRSPGDAAPGPGTLLRLGAGLAIDARGQLLYLPQHVDLDLDLLLRDPPFVSPANPDYFRPGQTRVERASEHPPGAPPRLTIYRLCLSLAESHAGTEEIYGLSCPDDCARTGERSLRLEGVTLRATELPADAFDPREVLGAADPAAYLRNQLASQIFTREDLLALGQNPNPSLTPIGPLLAPEGPAGPAGARFGRGTQAPEDAPVCLGFVAVQGGHVLFLDPWIGRRERLEPPSERALFGLFGLRPLAGFFAQVMQFQHQLFEVASGRGAQLSGAAADEVLLQARDALGSLQARAAAANAGDALATLAREVPELMQRLKDLLQLQKSRRLPGTGALLDRGFQDLPPAGFLPVMPGGMVRQQVAQFFGQGVQLRFFSVRPDAIPRALLRAQHHDRIRLDAVPGNALTPLQPGLPRPTVDVLVPTLPSHSIDPRRDARWILFCQHYADEALTYLDPEEERAPDPATSVAHLVYRTPRTPVTDKFYEAESYESLLRLSQLVGKVYLSREKDPKVIEPSFGRLARAWGNAPRTRALMVQESRARTGTPDNDQQRLGEVMELNRLLLPPHPSSGNDWDWRAAARTFVADGVQAMTFFFTNYRVRVAVFDELGRRVRIREEGAILEFDTRGSLPPDQPAELNKALEPVLLATHTKEPEPLRIDLVVRGTPPSDLDLCASFEAALKLTDIAFKSKLPNEVRGPDPEEVPLFVENGVLVDALACLVFRFTA